MITMAGGRRALATLGMTAAIVAALAASPASAATNGSAAAVTGKAATASTSVTVGGVTITAKSDSLVTPQIVESSCGGKPNWVHLYTVYNGHLCFGYTGSISFLPNMPAYSICWGNNYGRSAYTVSNGIRYYNWIAIDGWSGNGTCPP
jgi:hypothetical protein